MFTQIIECLEISSTQMNTEHLKTKTKTEIKYKTVNTKLFDSCIYIETN